MKRKSGNINNDALMEQIRNFESALERGEYQYIDTEDLLDMMKFYLKSGMIEKADNLLNFGLTIHPDDTELLVEKAYKYLDACNLNEASAIADRITEQGNCDVILLRMEIALHHGNLKQAEELLEGLSSYDKADCDVVCDVADIFNMMGYHDRALKWLKGVEKEAGTKRSFIYALADTYGDLGNTDMAVEILNKIIDNDPYDAETWVNIGRCYYKGDRYEDVIEPCEFAIAADENYGEAYAMMAHAYMQLENFEKAEEYYREAIRRDGINEDSVHAFLGLCYSARDMFEEACREFDISLKMLKGNRGMDIMIDDILLNYAVCLGKIGLFDKSYEMAERVVKEHPNDVTPNLVALKLYIDGINTQKIDATIEKVHRMVIDRGEPTDFITLCECYRALGCHDEALNTILVLADRIGMMPELTPSIAQCFLLIGDMESFCRYDMLSDKGLSREEAYDIYLQHCEHDDKQPADIDSFWKMINDCKEELKKEDKNI